MPYGISGSSHVHDWLAATSEADRREALLVWTQAACNGPIEVSSGYVENQQNGRRVYYSDVPGAQTRVTYLVVDIPARCVHILDISDVMYGVP